MLIIIRILYANLHHRQHPNQTVATVDATSVESSVIADMHHCMSWPVLPVQSCGCAMCRPSTLTSTAVNS
eukprot:450705-Amphidinium_carterae.1